MPKIDYEKYLVRQTASQVMAYPDNENVRAMNLLSDAQVPDCNHCIEVAWITGMPRPGISREHAHACDEIVLFWGGDYQKPQVLGAEIEYVIGGQPITFNTTTPFYIPKRTPPGPAAREKFNPPHMAYMSGVQIPGVNYYIEFGWTFGMPVSKTAGPGMPEMAHNNHDEIVLHIGGNPSNPEDLGGEGEVYVGGPRVTFATTR